MRTLTHVRRVKPPLARLSLHPPATVCSPSLSFSLFRCWCLPVFPSYLGALSPSACLLVHRARHRRECVSVCRCISSRWLTVRACVSGEPLPDGAMARFLSLFTSLRSSHSSMSRIVLSLSLSLSSSLLLLFLTSSFSFVRRSFRSC